MNFDRDLAIVIIGLYLSGESKWYLDRLTKINFKKITHTLKDSRVLYTMVTWVLGSSQRSRLVRNI